jgi:hypothetical protein
LQKVGSRHWLKRAKSYHQATERRGQGWLIHRLIHG